MNWLFPAVLSTMIGTLVLCATYSYLFAVYRNRYLGLWATAWGIYVVRYVALLYMIARGHTPVVHFVNMSAIVAALYFLYRGTTEFMGDRPSRRWLAAFGAVELWTGIAIFSGLSFYQLTIPVFGFMAWVLCWVGLRFLQSDLRAGAGKRVTGVAFILWGLHQADYPLLRPVEWFAPFGYLIGTACAVTIAMGILLVYFEEVRAGLEESRKRVQVLFQKSPDLVLLHDSAGRILDGNAKAEELLGYSREKLLQLTLPDIVPDIVGDTGKPRWEDLTPGETAIIETLHRRQDGQLLPVEVHTTAIDWGGARYYLGFAHDLTERKQAEAALRASEGKYRTLFSEAPYGIGLADPESGTINECNQALCDLVGRSREELIGQPQSILHPTEERAGELTRSFRRHLDDREGEMLEAQVQTKDGEIREVEIKARRVRLQGRTLMLGFFHDVTDRVEAQRSLQESRERFALAMEASTDGLWDWDIATGHVYYSPAWFRILGLESGEPVHATWEERLHPEDRAGVVASLEYHLEGRTPLWRREHRLRSGDGHYVWVVGMGKVVLRNSAGEPLRLVGTMADISERKRAEQERDRLFAYSVDMLCVAGPDGRFLDLNPAWSRVLGWELDELKEMPWIDLVHPDDQARTAEAGKSLAQGTPALGFENRYRCKDGTYRWFEWNTFPLPEEGLLFGVARDVTDSKRKEVQQAQLEQQLRQSQKMEAIGTLAGGIAHDFNNILTPLMAHAEMALQGLPEGSPIRVDVEQILRSSERAADLVRRILVISRKGEQRTEAVKLAPLIEEVAKFLRASLPTTIEIEQRVDPHCKPVAANPTQVHQILLNLCTNAKDAMEERGGTLALSVEPAADEDHTKITVQDSGVGMSDSQLARIFEPYYTTKPPGKGSGLGLAVVHGIISSLGGRIDARSRPGAGTTFEVLLPVAPEGLPEKAQPTTLRTRGRGEHILVVDDEAPIVTIVKRHLENLGYRVTAFTSSQDALEAFRATPEAFDLILTDQTMPRLTGLALTREVHATHPDIPVILATGFTEGLDDATAERAGLQALLTKPYTMTELSSTLSQALRDARLGKA